MVLTRQFRLCTTTTSHISSFPGAIYTTNCSEPCTSSKLQSRAQKTASSSTTAATSMSAGESSWAMHIANFLASPHGREDMDHEAASYSSFSSGFSSSFDSLDDDDATFITLKLMCDDEEEDESLRDTACSSAAGPKVISSMENVDMKSKVTSIDAREFQMPQLAKYSIDAGSRQQVTSVHQEVINSCNTNEKAIYECNELRKKGLCLVPISMLIDYLG